VSRYGVKARIAEVFAAEPALAGLTVVTEWPGDNAKDSMLILGEMTGQLATTTIGRGPQRLVTDEFTIVCVLGSAGHLLAEKACRAAEEQFTTIREVVRRLHRLTDPDGTAPDGDTADYARIRSVNVGRFDGPNPVYPQPTKNAAVAGVIDFELVCVADY